MAITEQIPEFDETKLAQEGQSKTIFRSNATYMWNRIVAVVKSLNVFRTQINATQSEINATSSAVANMKQVIETTSIDIDSKKNDIDTKHSEVMNRVIPTEATYSEQTIDEKVRMSQILNLIGA